jgi:hypothetical protein
LKGFGGLFVVEVPFFFNMVFCVFKLFNLFFFLLSDFFFYKFFDKLGIINKLNKPNFKKLQIKIYGKK